jgi:Tfp pilus assembly protein PilF
MEEAKRCHMAVARALELSRSGAHEEALVVLTSAAAEPDLSVEEIAFVLDVCSTVANRAGDLKTAVEFAERSLAKQENAEVHFGLIRMYRLLGDDVMAKKHIEDCAEAARRSGAVHVLEALKASGYISNS